MKSTFKIDEKRKIITEILNSGITMNEYIKLKHDEFHHEKFNRNYNLITDFRNFDSSFNKNDLQDILNVFNENKGKVNREKSALVVSNVKYFKKVQLKTDKNSETPQEIKIFTNFEDAEKWILK